MKRLLTGEETVVMVGAAETRGVGPASGLRCGGCAGGNLATVGEDEGGVVPKPAISSGIASQFALQK